MGLSDKSGAESLTLAVKELLREVDVCVVHGRFDDAERLAREALAMGASAPVEHALAGVLLKKGDPEGASAAYERAIALDSGYARSLNNLANRLLERSPPERERALSLYDRSVESADATVGMRLNRARCLQALGRTEAARDAFEASIVRDGSSPKALLGVAQTFRAEGRELEAATRLEAALVGFPEDESLLGELGAARLAVGDAIGALEPLKRAVAKAGTAAQSTILVHLARSLRKTGRLIAAKRVLADIAGRTDLAPAAFEERGSLLLDLGRPAEAAPAFAEAEARLPFATALRVASSRIFAASHDDAYDANALGDVATAWGREVERALGADAAGPRWSDVDPSQLHLAFFSGDFREHVVLRFLAPVLDALAGRVQKISLFSVTCPRDERTEDLARRFDMIDLSGLSRDEAREAMIRRGVSVLVDLGAHTSGHIDLLCPRVAPVQLHYLGFPGPVGLRSIDYRVSDCDVDPGSDPDVDRRLLLDRCAWVYRVPGMAPVPRAASSAPRFACFARAMKVTPATSRLYSAILTQSPRATLVLGGKAYEDPDTFAELVERFDPAARS
ncbi:MAG: tetratricopeptide repeat protein, partial [Polyangiaceae bacterium]|nr:tetratricopeptide repeat protein [Polyangiaceae bacterium]